MSHIASGEVAKLSGAEVAFASALRLNWTGGMSGYTWSTPTGWSDLIRWLLKPFVDPTYPTPERVYCETGPHGGTWVEYAVVAEAHAALCGLTRSAGETDEALSRRCLMTEEAS